MFSAQCWPAWMMPTAATFRASNSKAWLSVRMIWSFRCMRVLSFSDSPCISLLLFDCDMSPSLWLSSSRFLYTSCNDLLRAKVPGFLRYFSRLSLSSLIDEFYFRAYYIIRFKLRIFKQYFRQPLEHLLVFVDLLGTPSGGIIFGAAFLFLICFCSRLELFQLRFELHNGVIQKVRKVRVSLHEN